jgi:hypothetical protein
VASLGFIGAPLLASRLTPHLTRHHPLVSTHAALFSSPLLGFTDTTVLATLDSPVLIEPGARFNVAHPGNVGPSLGFISPMPAFFLVPAQCSARRVVCSAARLASTGSTLLHFPGGEG